MKLGGGLLSSKTRINTLGQMWDDSNNKERNEKGAIAPNATEIQIRKDLCESSYAMELGNSEERDTFLDRHSLPRMNHEEIENLNGPIWIRIWY